MAMAFFLDSCGIMAGVCINGHLRGLVLDHVSGKRLMFADLRLYSRILTAFSGKCFAGFLERMAERTMPIIMKKGRK
jgi:hypothetical protein